jgi:hypothetical protein
VKKIKGENNKLDKKERFFSKRKRKIVGKILPQQHSTVHHIQEHKRDQRRPHWKCMLEGWIQYMAELTWMA